MQEHLFKLCADSLRTFANTNYNVKLKASHAHELVAGYFGYSSKNAMLADTNYPVSNLNQAEIIVMTSDDFIDQRRKSLKGLSSELPDSYTLSEAVYVSLFSDEWWESSNTRFRSFNKLAMFLIEKNDSYQNAFKFYRAVPMHHRIKVKRAEDSVLLTVLHAHQTDNGEMMGAGETTINLPRVAGHIGYGKPKISVGTWHGDARRRLESLEVQP